MISYRIKTLDNNPAGSYRGISPVHALLLMIRDKGYGTDQVWIDNVTGLLEFANPDIADLYNENNWIIEVIC